MTVINSDIHCLFYSGLLGIACLFDFDTLILAMCLIVGGLYAILSVLCADVDYGYEYCCDCPFVSTSTTNTNTNADTTNTPKPKTVTPVAKATERLTTTYSFIRRPPEPKKTFANFSDSDKAIVLEFYEKTAKSAIESKRAVELTDGLLMDADLSNRLFVSVPDMFPYLLERLKITDAWVVLPMSGFTGAYKAVPVVVAAATV
jgi:hypothetical protein